MAADNDGNDSDDQLDAFVSENPNLKKMKYGEPDDGDDDVKYFGDDHIPAVPGKHSRSSHSKSSFV